jgi:hypothetical protein
MSVAWYLGFGWVAMAILVASGVGINLSDGWLRWVLYVPFLLAGVYMTVRFRLYNSQLWRRVHSRAMIAYGRLAGQEYDAARKENRDYAVGKPCRALAELMFGQNSAIVPGLETERQAYYENLVASYPQVFVGDVKPDRHAAALEGVRRDIEASQLGPDIVIARAIERQHGGLEAARYLHALLLGRVH